MFFVQGNEFRPRNDFDKATKLPPGVYEINQDSKTGESYFEKIETNYDQIIDLPGGEFNYVVEELSKFLLPETEAKFNDYGFLYKRSALLHGVPGSGKTVIVNRVAEAVMKQGGIVLFNPHPKIVTHMLRILTAWQPETLVMVIFEELDELVKQHEGTLLSILDGEVQKNRIIYLATTNYIDRVPARIRRPGRFSSVIEVKLPTAAAREFYLNYKRVPATLIPAYVEKTEGFSIDEVKEVVLATMCLDKPLDETIDRLKGIPKEVEAAVEEDDDDDFFVETGH